jgi:hypothetical protein
VLRILSKVYSHYKIQFTILSLFYFKHDSQFPVFAAQAITLWYKSQRTQYVKLKKKVSGQSAPKLTYRQKWAMRNFSFLDDHLLVRTNTKTMGSLSSSQKSLGPSSKASDVDLDTDEDSHGLEQSPPVPSQSKPAAKSSSSATFDPEKPSTSTGPVRSFRRGQRRRPDVEDYLEQIASKMSSTSDLQEKVNIASYF